MVLIVKSSSFAQLGVGTKTPNAWAKLDITSASQGFLAPRMTMSNKNAITNPAEGLMIYCSNSGASGEVEYYNGDSWVNMFGNSAAALYTPAIGSNYQGEIVAYILQKGYPRYDASTTHGFIAADSDLVAIVSWCTGSYGNKGIKLVWE